jgi:hypothetical protein
VIGAVGATDLTSGWVTVLWILAAFFGVMMLVEPIRWAIARNDSSPEAEVGPERQPEPPPRTIHAPTIASKMKVFSPTITQADRPGWKAMCADGKSQQQPYGAFLYITSERETGRDFRCLLRREGQEPVNAHLQGGKVGIHSAHYPHAFPGAPPMLEGEYSYEWFGYVDNEPTEILLASGMFRVNNHLQVSCDADRPGQSPTERTEVRLTSSAVASPARRKSTYSTFGGQLREVNAPVWWRFFIGQGPDGVDLSCRKWQMDVPVSIACVVEDPKGVKLPGRLRRVGDDIVRCTYPGDFDVQPTAGLHFVQWLIARHHLFGEDVSDPNGRVGIVDPLEFTIDVVERDPGA